MHIGHTTRIAFTGLLVMATLAVSAAGSGALEPGGTFSDDNGSVHESSIEAIADEGITLGCNPPVNDMFCPNKAVTRAQMATFLARALNLPAATGSFADTADSVHAANIGALAAAGITQGCNPPVNDMFCPNKAVTRAQMATFLTRALNLDASPRIVVTAEQDVAGVEVGTAEADVVAELTDLFGPPTADEGGRCPYFLPQENMRYVRWGSLIVAIKTVDSGDGRTGLAGWRYKLDSAGDSEPGGPLAEHIEMPFGLELLDPIGAAVAAGGGPIETTSFGWTIVQLDDFVAEASGFSVDPTAPIDGVQQGFGFSCD